ncbi:surfactant protein B [Cooperia oncophora]
MVITFHRIQTGIIVQASEGFVCDECQVIVEDKEKQQEIRDFLSQNVCKHIPRYQGMCDMLIEQFLPEMFQELDTMLKDPKAACADVGFCPRTSPPRKLVGFIGFLSRL